MFNRRELLKMFGVGAIVAPTAAVKLFMEVQEHGEKTTPVSVVDHQDSSTSWQTALFAYNDVTLQNGDKLTLKVDPKHKCFKFRDGQGQEIAFLGVEGSMKYHTDVECDYQYDRGQLEHVRPVSLRTYIELNMRYEYMTASNLSLDMNFFRQAECGDLTLTCVEDDVSITFENFSWTSMTRDNDNGLLEISGISEPPVQI